MCFINFSRFLRQKTHIIKTLQRPLGTGEVHVVVCIDGSTENVGELLKSGKESVCRNQVIIITSILLLMKK